VLPRNSEWDLPFFTAFIRNEHVPMPGNVMAARVRRRRRAWGAMALRVHDREIDPGERDVLIRIAEELSGILHTIDRERSLDVRQRLDRRIMEELRPKDLFYQLLDGLRSLVRYDHSSALYVATDDTGTTLELAAEQIAWSKRTKSQRIGQRLAIDPGLQRRLLTGTARGFIRDGDRWTSRNDPDPAALATLLNAHSGDTQPGEPRAGAMICAPLVARDRVFGVLTISSVSAAAFGLYEVDLVQSFTPKALIALRNSQRAESWELRVLEAEKKQALANLARSVSHDVNNAIGAALPLTQQLIDDLDAQRLDPGTLSADLTHIEQSLRFCRRVFGGMLAFAKGNAETLGEASIFQAVRNVLSILSDSMKRQGIRIALEIDDDLPLVRGTQGDLQQLFLNLATNARDAMPLGGVLRLQATTSERSLVVTVSDTGTGMSPEQLERAFEPFFSTKPTGSGLGLATCQAIVWRVRGEIHLESEPGKGTTVEIRLPLARSAKPELALMEGRES
jgi:signal transduction histidine kinase